MATTLLIGTTKGLFILRQPAAAAEWHVEGPFCDGWPINHAIGEAGTGRLWAAGGSDWFGAGIWRSEDGGAGWQLVKLSNGQFDRWIDENPEMAAEFGLPLPSPSPHDGKAEALWSLGRAGGRLLAGGKPGVLFSSSDGGVTWDEVPGLNDHPSREGWQPGGAGLVLHTIVSAPEAPHRLWVGISAAGVFASEDGGATWEPRNRMSNSDAAEAPGHRHDGPDHEVGSCVHNLTRAPGRDDGSVGDILYQQNHHGVFRSGDGGRSWADISGGLPSRFGFPIAVHPRDPATVWVLPLNGDTQGRFPPDAAAAVWRSRDGGTNWTRHDTGLPDRNCFFTVLRQGMATDGGTPAGVYFGTNSGSVFASRDEGENWTEIARHLPTVLSVEALSG